MTIDGTHKPLNNIVCYNMVLDITQFKDRPQKCTDYIEQEKMLNGIMDGFFLYSFGMARLRKSPPLFWLLHQI